MATLERSEKRPREPIDQVQVHDIDVDTLQLLIETDSEELSAHEFDPSYVVALETAFNSTVFVTSSTGSIYALDSYGPTLLKDYHGTTVKVRQAEYTVTTIDGVQTKLNRYVNLIIDSYAYLRFFKTTEPEEDPGERSFMQVSSTKPITKVQLVIDWNNE